MLPLRPKRSIPNLMRLEWSSVKSISDKGNCRCSRGIRGPNQSKHKRGTSLSRDGAL